MLSNDSADSVPYVQCIHPAKTVGLHESLIKFSKIPDIWKTMIYNSLISNFCLFFVDAILVNKTEYKFQMLCLARRDLSCCVTPKTAEVQVFYFMGCIKFLVYSH